MLVQNSDRLTDRVTVQCSVWSLEVDEVDEVDDDEVDDDEGEK